MRGHSRARIVGDGERQRGKAVAGRAHRLQDGDPHRRFQALGRSVPVLATTLAALRPGRLRYTASVALRSVSDARRSFTVVMDTTVMVKLYKAGMVANLSVNK